MGALDFLKTILETREMHSIEGLRTHYYKTNYTKVKEWVLNYVKSVDYTTKTIDDTHGEIYLQGKKSHIIVSIVQVTPVETAVDLKVQYYGLIGWNKPKKTIQEVYDYLDQKLPFKGISLHP
ncbi:MAG: hypothetical protein UMR38_03830 [Candidatus Izemoplasma sp.]|nr:hypothetical protein [Candidatus Izemoplasma sp.]